MRQPSASSMKIRSSLSRRKRLSLRIIGAAANLSRRAATFLEGILALTFFSISETDMLVSDRGESVNKALFPLTNGSSSWRIVSSTHDISCHVGGDEMSIAIDQRDSFLHNH